MNRNDLYIGMSEVDDAVLDRSETMVREKRKKAWVKWVIPAACLCFVLGIGVPVLFRKGGPGQEDPLRPLNVIEFGGAYYEELDMEDTDILDKYNLPHKISEEMVGACLGNGLNADGSSAKSAFYQYLPYSDEGVVREQLNEFRCQRAVYVLEDSGEYSFAVFCNFVSFDSNTHTEASELFAVYGIDEAKDITSITLGDEKIIDPERIVSLYSGMTNSISMGNEDFQRSVFGDMEEQERQEYSEKLADSMVAVRIITAEGVAINNISYYPEINCIYWALSYYTPASVWN